MRLSRGEIHALCLKAARGAGLPLGHAEDLARVAGVLAERGHLPALYRALSAPVRSVDVRDGVVSEAKVALAGPTVLDLVLAGGDPVVLQAPDAPEVMKALVEATAPGVGLRDVPGGLEVFRTEADGRKAPIAGQGPIDVPEDVCEFLQALAARTYVPASDASREAGAGAGLIDND